MRLFRAAFAGIIATLAATPTLTKACTNCTNESTEPIEPAPAPWTLKGDIYGIFLLPGLGLPLLGASPEDLPVKAFPPLERKYQASIAGEYVGKIGMIQVLRYTESPVGPYDELLIIPGFFEYENEGEKEEGVRVSRIYVSQKYTCWNGRVNWNIPKHLARFDWTYEADGSTTVKVYPFDTTIPNSEAEAFASEKPFFQMTFAPLLPENLLNDTLSSVTSLLSSGGSSSSTNGILPSLLTTLTSNGLNLNPSIPFTTDLYSLLGIDATLKQPPVPYGNDAFSALGFGGPTWKSVVPGQFTTQANLGTVDLDQSGTDGEGSPGEVNAVGDEWYENFWPGLPRVNVGIRMKDATITFSEGTDMPNVVA
ncbi:hypothetical protein SMMN14_01386 [Sphaerulina musiva]